MTSRNVTRSPSGTSGPWTARIGTEERDDAWDRFLQEAPRASHVQSTPWARVKGMQGWRPVRVVALEGPGGIVGGAQVLVRDIPLLGSVGYIPGGPIVPEDNPAFGAWFTGELLETTRAMGIQVLLAQPPAKSDHYLIHLRAAGFRPSRIDMTLTATTVLDLRPDLDSLLAAMKSKTRYNVRRGLKKGIQVRMGTAEADVARFHQLLVATSERQGFRPLSEAALAGLVNTLAPLGHCRLFLAEYEGEAVSGLLAIPFGDTVVYKRGAWAGTHGEKRPNEAMHWTAIRWAKEAGYHFYDFDGMERAVAELVLAGREIPEDQVQTVTRFKLGFNGAVLLRPDIYECVGSGLISAAWKAATSERLASSRLIRLLKGAVR